MILRCWLCTVLLIVSVDVAGCASQAPALRAPSAPAASTRPSATPGSADCTESIPNLFERVSPSVVSISAVSMDRFEGDSGIKNVVGSGFIISDDGLVLTNSHVVFDRQAISVTLDDGRRSRAVLLGADPIYDLAVLRIADPRPNPPKAVLGNSNRLRIGEDVLAIGNPLALEQTLTRGVVSGLNRFVAESPFSLALPLIQTDAPINPGNSGGPLFNRCGEAIGITTLMAADAQNIGFAVPINIARQCVPELVRNGRIVRPWFGMVVKPISRELVELINLPLVEGLLVEKVDTGSPAQQAGIRDGSLSVAVGGDPFLLGGDIITDMNGLSPTDPVGFAEMVDALRVGDSVRLTLFRDGHSRQANFTLVERPQLPGDFRPSPFSTGLQLRNPTGQAAK